MGIDRRSFLKIAGLSAVLGVGGGSVADLLVNKEVEAGEAVLTEKGLHGKRWAMVVNVKKCSEHKDCNKCIEACHTAHNVPNFHNPKDEVKWIWKEDYEHAFPDHQNEEYQAERLKEAPFILMCNHCDHPPCVRVCPTKATFRRPDGIVAMDYHRCIGCRFCMAACPYGSRSFNWRDPRPFIEKVNNQFPTRMRGVVEKCNFCVERLAQGLGPACVEACPHGCLVFGDLEDPESAVRKVLMENVTIRRKPELGTMPSVFYIV